MAYNWELKPPMERGLTDMVMMPLQIWIRTFVSWLVSIVFHPAVYGSVLTVVFVVLSVKAYKVHKERVRIRAERRRKELERKKEKEMLKRGRNELYEKLGKLRSNTLPIQLPMNDDTLQQNTLHKHNFSYNPGQEPPTVTEIIPTNQKQDVIYTNQAHNNYNYSYPQNTIQGTMQGTNCTLPIVKTIHTKPRSCEISIHNEATQTVKFSKRSRSGTSENLEINTECTQKTSSRRSSLGDS